MEHFSFDLTLENFDEVKFKEDLVYTYHIFLKLILRNLKNYISNEQTRIFKDQDKIVVGLEEFKKHGYCFVKTNHNERREIFNFISVCCDEIHKHHKSHLASNQLNGVKQAIKQHVLMVDNTQDQFWAWQFYNHAPTINIMKMVALSCTVSELIDFADDEFTSNSLTQLLPKVKNLTENILIKIQDIASIFNESWSVFPNYLEHIKEVIRVFLMGMDPSKIKQIKDARLYLQGELFDFDAVNSEVRLEILKVLSVLAMQPDQEINEKSIIEFIKIHGEEMSKGHFPTYQFRVWLDELIETSIANVVIGAFDNNKYLLSKFSHLKEFDGKAFSIASGFIGLTASALKSSCMVELLPMSLKDGKKGKGLVMIQLNLQKADPKTWLQAAKNFFKEYEYIDSKMLETYEYAKLMLVPHILGEFKNINRFTGGHASNSLLEESIKNGYIAYTTNETTSIELAAINSAFKDMGVEPTTKIDKEAPKYS